MYSSVNLVREFSGFDSQSNITDPVVRGKIEMADSMIDGKVSIRYQMPLTYRKENTIAFSGTASENTTMTVTINGTGYDIAVSNGDTASEVADAVRAGLSAVTTLHTDPQGSGGTVLLISDEDSSDTTTAAAQVNVSAVDAVAGLTITIGTVLDRYPPLIRQLSAEIAAGLLLVDSYGVEQDGRPTNGSERIMRAEELLQKIEGDLTTNRYQRITDEITKAELPTNEEREVASYPNLTSYNSASDPTTPRVEITQRF